MKTGLAILCATLLVLASAWAQSDANKGSITGTISDPNQAVIPNAKVTVSSPATGLTRDTTTNEAGQYRFAALDPGTYQVKADAPGFATATANDVLVTVGSSVSVNFTVSLQATVQTVDVSSSLVSVTESNPSQTLNLQAIQNLPINGRRFQDFATLTPTVQTNDNTRGQLSFVGQRGINSNVMVDGTDYNEPFFGGIRGGERSIFAFTVPQSSIQEFQSVTAGYAAEYGRSTGGILNAITRSGSNAFHGDAFYQLRHKELGLKNPLNQQSLETQHQFGGGVGGPIQRDKLFFFAAAERQKARFPRLVRFATLDSVAGSLTPDIQPAYDYFRSLEKPFDQTNDVTAVLGRIDYQFSGGSRLTGRYNYSNNLAKNAVSTGTSLNPQTTSALSNNGDEKDNTHTAVGQLTSVLSPALLNDFRVQFSREERPRSSNAQEPTVSAGNIGTFGTRSFLPTTQNDYRLQFADGLTLQRGNHSVKFGIDYSHIHFFQTFGFNQFGSLSISGSNVRQLLQILSRSGAGGNRFDDPSVNYSRQIGNTLLEASAQQLAFFAQDSWRINNSLTVSYGLRWEGQFNPSPATNNDFLVTNVRDFSFPLGRVNPAKVRSQLDQFAPRLGFAWNIGGGGKTIMRGQTGLFYAQTPLLIYSTPLNNFRIPPGDLSLAVDPTAGTVYQQFLAGGIDLNKTPLTGLPVLSVADVTRVIGGGKNPYTGANVITTGADNYRNPRAFQVTYGLEHELVTGVVADYQFNFVNTIHLERNIDLNVPRPSVRAGDLSLRPYFGLRTRGVTRPNPNIGQVLVKDSSARSNFQGHTFRLQYRLKKWQAAANYTLSYNRSDDDNERTATGIIYQNPFDLRSEYNWSSNDARHQFGGYTVYQGPWGIELSGLFRYRSGLPFDATTGGDTSELGSASGNVGNRPLNAPGITMRRNSFRNRGFKAVDLRFLKNFNITESAKVQFSTEMFNVFNWANMGFTGNAFIYGLGIQTNGQPAPIDARFMRLRDATGNYDASTTAQQGTPFQAQVGLRLIF